MLWWVEALRFSSLLSINSLTGFYLPIRRSLHVFSLPSLQSVVIVQMRGVVSNPVALNLHIGLARISDSHCFFLFQPKEFTSVLFQR